MDPLSSNASSINKSPLVAEHILDRVSRSDFLKLISAGMYWIVPNELDIGHQSPTTEEKKGYVFNPLIDKEPSKRENPIPRIAETKIQTALRVFSRTEKSLMISFWTKLVNELTEDEWNDMWQKMFYVIRYDTVNLINRRDV